MSKLTGYQAIAFAKRFGVTVTKVALDDGGPELDDEEEVVIVENEMCLVYVEVPDFDPKRMLATHAAIGSDGNRAVVWGLGTDAQMAVAEALRQYELEPDGAAFLRVVEVGPEVQERVQRGDITWSRA